MRDRISVVSVGMVVILIVAGHSATAQTISQWDNANNSGNWGTSGNWDPTGVPDQTADVEVTVNAGQTVSITTATSAATLTFGGGGTLDIQDSFTLSGDSGDTDVLTFSVINSAVTVASGVQVSVAGNLVINNGSVTGGKFVMSNDPQEPSQNDVVLQNGGTINVETLETTGSYDFSAGTLNMDIGGRTQGTEYDHLDIGGAFNINASSTTLNVSTVGGFNPIEGDTFDLWDVSGSTNNQFASVNLPSLGTDLGWDSSNLFSTGELTVIAVPEPASMAVLTMIGSAAVMLRRRRKAA